MLLRDIATKIRGQREKRGLKQQDIANALNISPQAVSKWERGENAPDIAVLSKLSKLLGVSVDWLLADPKESLETFEATVMVTSVDGAYQKSLGMKPRDFAVWANGFLYQETEMTLRNDGVPVKYVGDGFLGFFSGTRHQQRALKTALEMKSVIAEKVLIGMSAGEIYLGSVGHPDYARPDVMGQTVNIAFLTLDWAQQNTESGIAFTAGVYQNLDDAPVTGVTERVNFRGFEHPVMVYELK